MRSLWIRSSLPVPTTSQRLDSFENFASHWCDKCEISPKSIRPLTCRRPRRKQPARTGYWRGGASLLLPILGIEYDPTINMIRKVYGDMSMDDTQIKEWFNMATYQWRAFNAENVERVRAAINETRRLTVQEARQILHHDKVPAHSSNLIQRFWSNTTSTNYDSLPTVLTRSDTFWTHLCTKNGRPSMKTAFHCETCLEKPALCLGQCFEDYHGSLNPIGATSCDVTVPGNTARNSIRPSILTLYHKDSSSGSGSGSSGREGLIGGGMLATVHEDSELTETPLPLTRDMLLVTQKRRATELRPKPEAYAGVFLQTHVPKARMPYSSYNPVSRQDSELQSLSSDARTESDNMSLTDSSLDGVSSSSHHRFSRKQYQRHYRQVKEAANLNRDLYMHHTFIPRTQRIQKEQVHPMKPDQFAAILIEKLESVKRNQEAQEKLDRKLQEAEVLPPELTAAVQRSLTDTIREKLQLDDDNDQDILDQHVSRVWSDLTPSRSPGLISPRPKSPPHRSRVNLPLAKGSCGSSLPSHVNAAPPHPYQTRPYTRYPRKDKDVFSTFSSDSGNVHDFTEGSEHRHHLPKSKSMPDYTETYPQVPGHDSRLRQSRGKWSSKKTELTDSGVSVVSDTPPVSMASQFKDNWVMSWLMESGTGTGGVVSTHSERESVSSCGKHSHRRRSASPPAPAQPFVADPSMPPLPSPHTPTQLEEARRRLLEDELRTKQSRPRFGVCSKAEASQSGGSTLRRGGGGNGGGGGSGGGKASTSSYTIVVFSFCEEQFPYRTRIPGKQVTLRQFKEYLPKKGSYRYFFKTECEDLDMTVIQEEITDDNDILPLWEGKIMAQVKAAD
ncbi:Axin-1 [Homalodisca vitripennis]|nr:Axin-1 [Homalodisca vitripennis]